MKKKIPLIFVDHFLHKTPKRIAERIVSHHPYINMNLNNLPTDELYTETFLSNLDCEYLQSDHYHVKFVQQSSELAHILQKQSENQANRQKEVKNQF